MMYWDLTDFSDDALERLFYGPAYLDENDPKNKDETETEVPKPVAPKEELLKVLHAKGFDLNIPENTKAHHTDRYACTQGAQDGGKKKAPKLVVRRGQEITITVTFDRLFSLEKYDMRLVFKTAGEFAEQNECTHGKFDVDETGNAKYKANTWGGKLVKKDGKTATLEVHIPADCAIGNWKVFVETRAKNKDGKQTILIYGQPEGFYILFNPWCKDDTAYMKETDDVNEHILKNEYILNDHGCIYTGNEYYQQGKEWNFGQFEDGILEASFFIINKCLKPKMKYKLSDPVRVARIIAQVVNSNDDDKGVVSGNWSDDYSGGDSPTSWYGSVLILKKYMETKSPVKYGQCWVYSGVTTTVCRAVGLPARSITNFASAHDNDESNTIDKYFKEKDNDGILTLDERRTSDSVWNFHVWNEAWFARPDITGNDGKYDGWQVIDATPQETSDGIYTCGPCPVYAVKQGLVNTPYDCSFIFSEVNADVVHWKPTPDGYKRFKSKIDVIGKCISTKAPKVPNGKPYADSDWLERFLARLDVTDTYKYPDGSEENRTAVMKAVTGARRPKHVYSKRAEKEVVEFKLLHDAELHLGKDVEVKLTAKNASEYSRELTAVNFRFLRQDYRGWTIGEPFKEDNQDSFFKDNATLMLEPNKEYEFKVTLSSKDYLPNLDDGQCMSIQAFALVNCRPMQHCAKIHSVEFISPRLQVKLPSSTKTGTEFDALVTFKNPLQDELTDCTAGYEGGGFPHMTGVKQNNVPAQGTFEGKFKLKATTAGTFTLTFKFTSKQLKHLSGAATIEVLKDNTSLRISIAVSPLQ